MLLDLSDINNGMLNKKSAQFILYQLFLDLAKVTLAAVCTAVLLPNQQKFITLFSLFVFSSLCTLFAIAFHSLFDRIHLPSKKRRLYVKF